MGGHAEHIHSPYWHAELKYANPQEHPCPCLSQGTAENKVIQYKLVYHHHHYQLFYFWKLTRETIATIATITIITISFEFIAMLCLLWILRYSDWWSMVPRTLSYILFDRNTTSLTKNNNGEDIKHV